MAPSYLKRIGAVKPADARGPAVFSRHSDFRDFGKHQIPSLTWAAGYWWLANYGAQAPFTDPTDDFPNGTGEGPGCLARLLRSAGAFASDMTWDLAGTWRSTVDTESVQQPMVGTLSDGNPFLAYVFRGTGGYNRNIWGTTILNPGVASAADLTFTRNVFLGVGFVGPLRYIDGTLYTTCYEAVLGGSPPWESYQGNKLNRIDIAGNIPVPTQVSIISDPKPEADRVDYYETSIVKLVSGIWHAMFRTQAVNGIGRQWTSTAPGPNGPWSLAQEFTLLDTVSSRVDRIVLPDGRIAMLYNESLTKREKMTLAILSADHSTVIGKVVVDSRGASAPHPSYGFLALDPTDPAHVYMTWDCGRGREDPPTLTNDIKVAKVNIADAANSVLTMVACTLTS